MTPEERSAAARRANETRRADADIALLREHFVGIPKNEVRSWAIDHLEWHTPEGGLVGDTLGPGWSALDMTARGMSVVAAEDCSWSRKRLDDDLGRARAAALRMGEVGGFRVHIGNFAEITAGLSTAFFDPCGPYAKSTSRCVQAMDAAGLNAFALTAMLSRLDGKRGLGPDYYLAHITACLRLDAPHYRVQVHRRYEGTARIPMVVYVLVRKDRKPARRCGHPYDGMGGRGLCAACYGRWYYRSSLPGARRLHGAATDADARKGFVSR